ncbi:terpene synthase-like protein, partial [Leptotrombidium deliense]
MDFRKFTYPKIHCCFPRKIHADYEKIYEETLQWAIDFKLHSAYDKYKKENLTKLTCVAYPDGEYERVLLINKWMIHIFALDDVIESNVVECPFFGPLVYHGTENKDVISLMDK